MNRLITEHELKLAQQRQQRLLQDQQGYLYLKGQRKTQETNNQAIAGLVRKQRQPG